MSRQIARASRLLIDLVVLLGAFVLAFVIRFDGVPPADHVMRLFFTAPYVVAIEFLILRWLGVHRFVWRYVGLREVVRILLACAACAVTLSLWRMSIAALDIDSLRRALIPYGVVAINFILQFLGIAGVRVLRRLQGERRDTVRRVQPGEPVRTMLVGAGQAGVLVARELSQRPDLGLRPVGFLDDDNNKLGMVLHGIPVVGKPADMAELCARLRADQVLITIANAPGQAIRRLRELADAAGRPVKIIPGLYEIVGGQVNLSRIRNIAIEDLLGRDPIALDLEGISEHVEDSVMLVTGAGGSIGSELCRQLMRFRPQRLVLVERAENNLFHIHRELLAAYPDAQLEPCIADITDAARMEEIFEQQRPTMVFHAAAHKHVPMMEWNRREAIKNNVFGTKLVADLSARFEVATFVMISTDKAVNPTSMMGASKRGSAGSVIPIFQEQISRGGPVTVTHPDMRRYFMTIPEACQLVLQAASMGEGGEIFILDMGEPVRIVDLARDLIALSGLRVGEDIDIEFSGVRPGEKLFEELSTDAECADKTRHPKIFVGRIEANPFAQVNERLRGLRSAVDGGPIEDVLSALRGLVPEYKNGASEESPAPLAIEAMAAGEASEAAR
jgi:FlaA1/EpsC-like NDP-sugar epimerase